MPGREIATRRYEREQPGEMIHVDIKKLGKFNQIGHRITGDRTGRSTAAVSAGSFLSHLHRRRLARGLQQIMKTERSRCAVAFLKAAVAYNESLGITVLRAMTDNGSCYRSKAFARACRRLWLKHVRTKPYPREPTGKAEGFIQTSLREWAEHDGSSWNQLPASRLLQHASPIRANAMSAATPAPYGAM
jgi:transposase InsO family protein